MRDEMELAKSLTQWTINNRQHLRLEGALPPLSFLVPPPPKKLSQISADWLFFSSSGSIRRPKTSALPDPQGPGHSHWVHSPPRRRTARSASPRRAPPGPGATSRPRHRPSRRRSSLRGRAWLAAAVPLCRVPAPGRCGPGPGSRAPPLRAVRRAEPALRPPAPPPGGRRLAPSRTPRPRLPGAPSYPLPSNGQRLLLGPDRQRGVPGAGAAGRPGVEQQQPEEQQRGRRGREARHDANGTAGEAGGRRERQREEGDARRAGPGAVRREGAGARAQSGAARGSSGGRGVGAGPGGVGGAAGRSAGGRAADPGRTRL